MTERDPVARVVEAANELASILEQLASTGEELARVCGSINGMIRGLYGGETPDEYLERIRKEVNERFCTDEQT